MTVEAPRGRIASRGVCGRCGWTPTAVPPPARCASRVLRSGCPDMRCTSAAEGRKAAVAHVNMRLAHLREDGGPRGAAWCGCRTTDCAWHPTVGTVRRTGGFVRVCGPDRAIVADCGNLHVLRSRHSRLPRPCRSPTTAPRCAPGGSTMSAGT